MLLKIQSSIWTTLKNVNSRFDDIIQLNTILQTFKLCGLSHITISFLFRVLNHKFVGGESYGNLKFVSMLCMFLEVQSIPKPKYSNGFLVHFIIEDMIGTKATIMFNSNLIVMFKFAYKIMVLI